MNEKIHVFHYSKAEGGVARVPESKLSEGQAAQVIDRLFHAWNAASGEAQAQLLEALDANESAGILPIPSQAKAQQLKEDAEKEAKRLAEEAEAKSLKELEKAKEAFASLDKKTTPPEILETLEKMLGGEVRTEADLKTWHDKLMASYDEEAKKRAAAEEENKRNAEAVKKAEEEQAAKIKAEEEAQAKKEADAKKKSEDREAEKSKDKKNEDKS